MDYQLVAIDLDDTLLADDLTISPQTIEAIHQAIEKGVTVTFATGRMYQSAVQYAKKIQLDVPIITYQGALIKNVLSGEVLFERLLDEALAISIIKELRAKNHHIQIYLHDEIYLEKDHSFARDYSKASNVPYHVVDDLIQTMREMKTTPAKILTIEEPAAIQEIHQEFQIQFGNSCHITISKPHFMEITHKEATKGKAIEYLAHLKGITLDQVIAIGDSMNDRDMLEVAGLGVAMGNAHPEIKAMANYVTKTNNDHGVWEVFQKFVL